MNVSSIVFSEHLFLKVVTLVVRFQMTFRFTFLEFMIDAFTLAFNGNWWYEFAFGWWFFFFQSKKRIVLCLIMTVFSTFFSMSMRVLIRNMMTIKFDFSLTCCFFLDLVMKVNDEFAIVIVIIFEVVLANWFIGVLGHLQVRKGLRFISVLHVFSGIVRILLVNVIWFCFKT